MARKRRSRGGDDGGGDRWLGTYGDMVTLLMAFFVMLYAISQVDETKFVALVRGLDVFGNTTNLDGMLESGPALLDDGTAEGSAGSGDMIGELSLEPRALPAEEASDGPSSDASSDDGSDTAADDADDAAADDADDPPDAARKEQEATDEQIDQVARQLDAALDRAGLPRTVTDVRGDPRGVVISVSSDDLLFALGSPELSQLGRRIVGAVAAVVRRYDEEVVVEGHTDNLPLRRPGYSNWNLSTDRAVAVVERLHRIHDIDQRRLVASGYGEFRPLEPNTSTSNRARNRRVDVLLRVNEE